MTTNRNRNAEFTSSPKEAMLYAREKDAAVTCYLCAHRCYVPAGREGICKVRENRAGFLYTRVYDQVISANIDPIEKKPLFHFLPGSEAFSIATAGCNFHCSYCQNWEISQISLPKAAVRSVTRALRVCGTVKSRAPSSSRKQWKE